MVHLGLQWGERSTCSRQAFWDVARVQSGPCAFPTVSCRAASRLIVHKRQVLGGEILTWFDSASWGGD